jgi:exosome complex RNA-binding protein Rrp42 (RNase PH superfamily)
MSSEASTSNAKLALELKKLQPRAYLQAFVEHGYRPDGRSFDAFRPVSVNVGKLPLP